MSITAERNDSTTMQDITGSFIDHDELVFVVVDVQDNGKAAIEGRYGIIAMGDSVEALQAAIVANVQEHFQGKYEGKIRIRQFTDTVISI